MASSSEIPKPPKAQNGRFRNLIYSVVRRARSAALLVGAGTVLAVISDIENKRRVENEFQSSEGKKRVLVLPFHRMKLVEKRKFDFQKTLASLARDEDEEYSRTVEVEVKELVDVIHKAAEDPNIVALYGYFGHGFTSSLGGWAQVEEVRNALKVFGESHRLHREPNLNHDDVLVRNGGTPKYSFAFADSFANPMDAGNKEYYLASAFSHVHLQSQGELNLFGLGASQMFLRGTLDKYGVKAHVFKHGKYKNAPDTFTERGYSREHKQNVTNIVNAINNLIYDRILQSRRLQAMDGVVWQQVQGHGTFTATQAQTLGLIDYTPQLDPLDDLVYSNKNDESKEEMMKKYGKDADLHHFAAKEQISFGKYKALLDKRKMYQDRTLKAHTLAKMLAEKSSATEWLISALGFTEKTVETRKGLGDKVALVHVSGGIDESMARKTVAALKKIKKQEDIKAVVLRVDSPGGSVTASERILQQIRDMSQPVVCSMGNVAASGGYYVAVDCDRIFALPNTVTGSIGVFGVKLDLTDFASRYGVQVDTVVSGGGPHTFTYSPLHPLTKPMKENFARNIDRYYDRFKAIVANGRCLPLEQVEDLAQGRVWTGEQAKKIGLVDELGGLDRALAYAKRKYTGGEDASVEVWPKRKSMWDRLLAAVSEDDAKSTKEKTAAILGAFCDFDIPKAYPVESSIPDLLGLQAGFFAGRLPNSVPSSASGIMLTADENMAVQTALLGCLKPQNLDPWTAPGFWE